MKNTHDVWGWLREQILQLGGETGLWAVLAMGAFLFALALDWASDRWLVPSLKTKLPGTAKAIGEGTNALLTTFGVGAFAGMTTVEAENFLIGSILGFAISVLRIGGKELALGRAGLLALLCVSSVPLQGCGADSTGSKVLPDYTAGEAKCMGEAEVAADIALAKCAEKHGVVVCPNAESDVIEQTQIEETMKCLARY